MKRVRFHEEVQNVQSVMEGDKFCIRNGQFQFDVMKCRLFDEEDIEQRRSSFQTKRQQQRELLRHSHALRKAGRSEKKTSEKTKAVKSRQRCVAITTTLPGPRPRHGHCCC